MPVIPHEATAYLADKQLKTSWHWGEIYAEEHNVAFTVAKVMEQDVLDAIHRQIVRAVESGETFHTFRNNLLDKLGEGGWGNYKEIRGGEVVTRLSDSRLQKIFDTNFTQAHNAGCWRRFQANKELLPYLRYRIGYSVEHRQEHLKWDGIILPVDHPWWQTHMPMNGWGCNCWVEQITREEAEQLGITPDDDIPYKDDYHDWQSHSTGKKHKVPKGIDPGFEHNPGMQRQKTYLQLLADKIEAVAKHSPVRAKNTLRRLIDLPLFRFSTRLLELLMVLTA